MPQTANTLCPGKHTKFQPTMSQWKCPKCGTANDGSTGGSFFIDDSRYNDCEWLHVDDYIKCDNCNSSWKGQGLATLMTKALNQKPCPHCKGTGFINKPSTERNSDENT